MLSKLKRIKLKLLFLLLFIKLGPIVLIAQNDTIISVKKIPQKFKFIDFNSDEKISQAEVDFVINSRLDNVAKYSPSILDEFVAFLEMQKNNPAKIDSLYFNDKNNSVKDNIVKFNEPSDKYSKEDEEDFELATDRPHQTETTNIIPKKLLQIENGFTIENIGDKKAREEVIGYSSLLLKVGIGKGIDLRFATDILRSRTFINDSLSNSVFGWSGLTFGGKKSLAKGRGWIPTTTLMVEIYLPNFGTKDFRPGFTGGTVRMLCEHEIGERLEFEYNFGPDWGGSVANASFFYASSLTYNIVGPLSIYAETFGFFTEKSNLSGTRAEGGLASDIRFDGGFVFLARKNLQFDLEGGFGVTDFYKGYFVSVGFVWRMPR